MSISATTIITPGAVHALQGHPGQLLFIHPGPLSQERRIPRHIQQIIHDLEGDPQMLAVKPAELHRRRVRPRQGQAHFHRRLQEIGGLMGMDIGDQLLRGGAALHRHIHSLPGNHPGHPRVAGQQFRRPDPPEISHVLFP